MTVPLFSTHLLKGRYMGMALRSTSAKLRQATSSRLTVPARLCYSDAMWMLICILSLVPCRSVHKAHAIHGARDLWRSITDKQYCLSSISPVVCFRQGRHPRSTLLQVYKRYGLADIRPGSHGAQKLARRSELSVGKSFLSVPPVT